MVMLFRAYGSYIYILTLILLVIFLSYASSVTGPRSENSLQFSINELSELVLPYAIALAGIGTLSMALLEAIKKIFNMREKYHMRILEKWISGLSDDETQNARACAQLLKLTTGQAAASEGEELKNYRDLRYGNFSLVPENSLFSLELEKMLGQIETTIDIVLNAPEHYDALYELFVSGADENDLKTWRKYSQKPANEITSDPAIAKQVTDALGRLQQHVERRLDAFQLNAKFVWKKNNQIAAMGIGFTLLFGVLCYTYPSNNFGMFFVYVLVSLFGGIVAPVAKDLVVAFQSVRSRG